jgi:hypothetical protein
MAVCPILDREKVQLRLTGVRRGSALPSYDLMMTVDCNARLELRSVAHGR